MKAFVTTVAMAMTGLVLLCAGPALADEDCDNAVKNINGAVQVAALVMQMDMAEITKDKPADDKAKASVKNKFCSASGEFLGVSRVYRAVASGCLQGNKRRDTVAALDKSIKELGDSVRQTCE